MSAKCKHCRRGIAEGVNGWYHTGTEADRCRDDASFTYAEPRNIYPSERNIYCGRDHLYKEATPAIERCCAPTLGGACEGRMIDGQCEFVLTLGRHGLQLIPDGVSVTEGEYLRDWRDAHQMNYLFDKHSEALTTYGPCGCLTNSAKAHRASCPEHLGEVPWADHVYDDKFDF